MNPVLRFLCTGDIQAHNWRQFSYTRPDGMNSRLANCLKVFRIIRKEAKARGITKSILNGDVFEESDYIPVEVYDAVYLELERSSADLETAINIGNHDVTLASSSRLLHSLRPFRKVAKIIETPETLWEFVHAVPFDQSPEKIKDAIGALRPSHPSCLLLHHSVQGGRVGPKAYLLRCPIKLKDLHPRRFDLVLLSDFHTTQWLADNVLYMGSPLQHTFGETHSPAIWDVSLLDRFPWYRLEKIKTSFPRFKRIRVRDLKELRAKINALHGNYVKVSLPVGSKVEPEEIERLINGAFQFQIERRGREDDEDSLPTRALDAHEFISKHVRASVKRENDRKRLVRLGIEIYG